MRPHALPMKRMRILVVLLSLLLGGCWDRLEINDMAIVTGTAIDKQEDKYMVTVQFPLPSQMGGAGSQGGGGGTSGSKSWHQRVGVATSLQEANAQVQNRLSRRLNFSHRRIILIGEQAAKAGIDPILDTLGRVPQKRLSSLLVITEGSAQKTLGTQTPVEQYPAEAVRELIQLSLRQPTAIKTVYQAMLTDGVDPSAPYIALVPLRSADSPEETAQTLSLEGIALFNSRNKLAGFVKDEEAKGLGLAMDMYRQPSLTIKVEDGEATVNVVITNQQISKKTRVTGRDVTAVLDFRLICIVSENTSPYPFVKDQDLLKKLVSQEVERLVKKGVKQAQALGADPIGIGESISRDDPAAWKRIKGDWERIYPRTKLIVRAQVEIENAGIFAKPINPQEKEQK